MEMLCLLYLYLWSLPEMMTLQPSICLFSDLRRFTFLSFTSKTFALSWKLLRVITDKCSPCMLSTPH